ncbi:MAG: tetratricopeptide repeat protein [Nitrospira sp.]|nr:tetratricopeptide repeat protein [Nitrospira sp.]MDE0405215.1 tetratricopeptide repeat protein [Nitrospira sp.]MDE0485828.1 tetratricopeptide repeat protein [Nitrospira sp.]
MTYKIRHISKQVGAEVPQLLSRSERMWLFAELHRRALITGIVVAIAVVILLGALYVVQYQQEQEALALEHQAAQAYLDRSLVDVDTATEKLQEAITLYRRIIQEFPRTASARSAWYMIGNALAEQDDHAGAIEAYQRFIDQAGNSPALLGLVYQRLGASHLASGDREKGITAYTQVLQMPQTLNKDQVLFELAKLDEHEKRNDEALARYKQLLDEHPNSPYASEATLRVKILEPPVDEPEAAKEEPEQQERQEGENPGG